MRTHWILTHHWFRIRIFLKSNNRRVIVIITSLQNWLNSPIRISIVNVCGIELIVCVLLRVALVYILLRFYYVLLCILYLGMINWSRNIVYWIWNWLNLTLILNVCWLLYFWISWLLWAKFCEFFWKLAHCKLLQFNNKFFIFAKPWG